MAGLFDFGNGAMSQQDSGLLALAAGMISGKLDQGLLGYQQAMSPENQLRTKLMQAQVGNYESEIEARKLAATKDARQQKQMEELLGGGQPSYAPGQLGSGSFGAIPTSTGVPAIGPAQSGGLMGLSQKLGIPREVIQADIVFNGGKKISEMLATRSAPKWENVGGNLVNTNAQGFQGGFQPGMSTSANGQVTAWAPDGAGGIKVGAPSGAIDTYRAYQNAGESVKAAYDPVTVTPAGQPPQMTTRGKLVSSPAVSGGMRVSPTEQAARDSDATFIKQGELTKAQERYTQAIRAGDQSAAQRAQGDIAALQRELGGGKATVGMPLQSPEEALRSQEGVKGDSKTNEARAADIKTAQKFLSVATQASKVLDEGPTGSGIGSAYDSAMGLVGYAPKGAVAAQQLKALGGWLVSNVPRMEGPQSNFDVGNYQRMAADVGNDMLPLARRKAALTTIQSMMQNIADGKTASTGGASGNWGGNPESTTPAKVVNDLPKTAPKGARARDTTTGEILRFNGMSWVKE